MLDATGETLRLQGARRLLLAVLQEAIGTFQRHATARDRRGQDAFSQADAWFASEETEWVFSFVSVCDALGIDAAYVRAGLRRWLEGHYAPLGAGWPLDMLPSPGPWGGPARGPECPVPSRPYRGSGAED